MKEDDMQLKMAKAQGYVPPKCTLPGPMVMALTTKNGDACRGCNENRKICEGRPK